MERVEWEEWMEDLTEEERNLIESIPETPEMKNLLDLSPYASAAAAA